MVLNQEDLMGEKKVKGRKRHIEISKKITNEWSVLAKRWVVERTFSWLNHFRRLAKDFEISLSSAEAFIIISHAAILLQRF